MCRCLCVCLWWEHQCVWKQQEETPVPPHQSNDSSDSTHVVLQEVLDGSVHLHGDVGASDLTHGPPQTQTHHYPCCGIHHINTCSTSAGCWFESQTCLDLSDAGRAESWCVCCPEVCSNCSTCHETSLFITQWERESESVCYVQGVKIVAVKFPLNHRSGWGVSHSRMSNTIRQLTAEMHVTQWF